MRITEAALRRFGSEASGCREEGPAEKEGKAIAHALAQDRGDCRGRAAETWDITVAGLPVYWIFPNVILMPFQAGAFLVRAYPTVGDPGRNVSRIDFYMKGELAHATGEQAAEVALHQPHRLGQVLDRVAVLAAEGRDDRSLTRCNEGANGFRMDQGVVHRQHGDPGPTVLPEQNVQTEPERGEHVEPRFGQRDGAQPFDSGIRRSGRSSWRCRAAKRRYPRSLRVGRTSAGMMIWFCFTNEATRFSFLANIPPGIHELRNLLIH